MGICVFARIRSYNKWVTKKMKTEQIFLSKFDYCFDAFLIQYFAGWWSPVGCLAPSTFHTTLINNFIPGCMEKKWREGDGLGNSAGGRCGAQAGETQERIGWGCSDGE